MLHQTIFYVGICFFQMKRLIILLPIICLCKSGAALKKNQSRIFNSILYNKLYCRKTWKTVFKYPYSVGLLLNLVEIDRKTAMSSRLSLHSFSHRQTRTQVDFPIGNKIAQHSIHLCTKLVKSFRKTAHRYTQCRASFPTSGSGFHQPKLILNRKTNK